MNFLLRLIFIFKKPKIIVVAGKGSAFASEAIYQILRGHFKVKRLRKFPAFFQIAKSNVLIFENLAPPFLEKSSLAVLVATGDGEKTAEIQEIVKKLSARDYLILNFENETIREMKELTNLNVFTFGFQEKADVCATDIKTDEVGTNFKINYKGNIVPIWLAPTPNEDKSPSATKIDEVSHRYGVGVGKEQIYASLSAIAVGIIFDLNLVKISQALRNYRGLPK